jgi:hypothetical protein
MRPFNRYAFLALISNDGQMSHTDAAILNVYHDMTLCCGTIEASGSMDALALSVFLDDCTLGPFNFQHLDNVIVLHPLANKTSRM